jgi:transposase
MLVPKEFKVEHPTGLKGAGAGGRGAAGSTGNGTRSIDASGAGAPAACGRAWPPRRDDGRERALRHRQHYGSRPCLGSGRKRGIHQRALGRSRGGFTSKIHCLGDARGRPIAFDLTAGEAADCKSYDTLIDLPERAPDALVADKAYDSDAIRDDLKQRGIRVVIPPKSNRTNMIRYNKRLYRQRNCIERVLGHLKINRAIATRYDQLPDSFLGMLYLETARYWIKFVHAA